jgi:hypothetical protein
MAAPTLVATIPGGLQGALANWDGPTAGTTRVTSSFNVTTGDVLVFVGASDDGNQTFSAPSGGSLTWTSQVNIGTASASCRVVIYTATATATTSMTVTGTIVGSSHWGFRVYQFSDASIGSPASSQLGAGVAPSQAITTAAANSALVCICADWNATDGSTGGPTPRVWRTVNSITPTSGNGLEKDYFRDSGGAAYTVYTAYWDDAGAAGSKTVGLTAPTMKASIAVIEIKGTGGIFDPQYIDWPLRQPHPKMRGAA